YLFPEKLISYIDNERISYLKLTPTLFSMIVKDNSFNEKSFNYVHEIMLGGESINADDVSLLQASHKHIKFMNHYGPTETTIGSVARYIQKDNLERYLSKPTIGKPIYNTKCYILSKNNKLTPIGCSGELYIGGDGVGIGYLGDNKLTKEKFIKNPFSEDPDSRLYKTGDLARYLPDGNIEFIGRIDNQVKIRGFRIELGEIEATINKIETIKDCVVIAKEDSDGNKRLVAYVVSADELNVQEIREGLSKSLPDYMVPSLFASLEKMPLTPNGKINRKALPEPEGNIETTNEYVAPRNETEQKLVEIWTKVLGVEKVGIYDNFFELGGHSLLATQVISKIRTEFNIELPLKTLFENSSIIDLAQVIDSMNEQTNIKQIEKIKDPSFEQNISGDIGDLVHEIKI
ncbi:MAG: non-ribosomal peptide synthetase, partial [bacterium]|nr:non-ribosomal peptide synthetase [bacterium]